MAFDWNSWSWPKKIAIAIPVAGAFLGWQYYNKGQEAVEMKARMVAMCEGEAPCVAAVEQHAEACFNDNYRMGRRSQGVKMDQFVTCVNDRSGTQFFSSAPSD